MTEPKIVPNNVDPAAAAPYFLRDENHYVPTEIARGGWGPSISGHVVGGLLGWAVERAVDDPQLQPARLTVDLPAPTALEPIELQTRVQHDRRRLRLVEAVLIQRGAPVARASALFLRRGAQPDGHVWSQTVQMPPLPISRTAPNRRFSCGPTAGAPGSRTRIPNGALPPDRNTPGCMKRAR